MSGDVASQKDRGAFDTRTMLLVIGIGIVAFVAMLLLGAYAPDFRSGRNGGSHALSKAATGFSGIVQLGSATGRNPTVIRAVSDLKNEDLAVITPDDAAAKLDDILEARGPRATLVVLPKWWTVADKTHPGWVNVVGLHLPGVPEGVLAPQHKFKVTRAKGRGAPLENAGPAMPPDIAFLAPAVVQTISGDGLQPVISTLGGEIVLGRVGTRNLYVLGDPDLINNHGMGNERQARSALALLDYLNSTDANSILFDVTANGLGRSKSPLKLLFDPPFTAVTISLFVAMLLAGWQAVNRFGPVRRRSRALAFGKAALVDNSAALVRKAGREAMLGGRYVDLVRRRAVELFKLPPTADADALDARLNTLSAGSSFAEAAAAARNARTREDLLGAARSLNQWLKEVSK